MNLPDDDWDEYLHYGRTLTDYERQLLHEDFLRRLDGDYHSKLPTTRKERLEYLEELKRWHS